MVPVNFFYLFLGRIKKASKSDCTALYLRAALERQYEGVYTGIHTKFISKSEYYLLKVIRSRLSTQFGHLEKRLRNGWRNVK